LTIIATLLFRIVGEIPRLQKNSSDLKDIRELRFKRYLSHGILTPLYGLCRIVRGTKQTVYEFGWMRSAHKSIDTEQNTSET